MYWADVMTVPFSLTGNPAINIPAMVERRTDANWTTVGWKIA
jgi:Asp-tRNA(Asn)/Glu-tRNA(Gln) amidotransferase A subunit family amidase